MRTERRRLMRPIDLMPGYKPVEYVTNSGSAYIRIMMDVSESTAIEVDFCNINHATYCAIAGWNDSTSASNTIHLSYDARHWKYGTALLNAYGARSDARKLDNPYERHRVLLTGTGRLDYDGVKVKDADGESWASHNDRMCVFGAYSTGSFNLRTIIRYYRERIWNGKELLYDFVPAVRIKDMKYGAYDMKSRQFYESMNDSSPYSGGGKI